MANLNKVMLIGRLTRDPEARSFQGGGKVTNFSFAVSNRKKNAQTGQWEDEPMFIDVAVFNRGESGKLADLVQDRCRKGTQLFLEGRLHLDQWEDRNGGGRRSKHKIVADVIQLFDPKQQQQQQHHEQRGEQQDEPTGDSSHYSHSGDGDIPF
ncbi:MAG: single-stranded DNA-binding protein [Gemmataceae bacterium]